MTHLFHTVLHLVDCLLSQVGDLALKVVDDDLEVLLLQFLLLNGLHNPLLIVGAPQLAHVGRQLITKRTCSTRRQTHKL